VYWVVAPFGLVAITDFRMNVLYSSSALKMVAGIDYSTLKMEATCSSKTSGSLYQTTRRHILEDGVLHGHHCDSLTSELYPLCILHVKEQHVSGHNDLPIDMKCVLRTSCCLSL
jgi:hypothetical protein